MHDRDHRPDDEGLTATTSLFACALVAQAGTASRSAPRVTRGRTEGGESSTWSGAAPTAAVDGLLSAAGAAAGQTAAEAAAEQREPAAALRRSYRRRVNCEAAELSEPLTESVLQPLADQGRHVLHDRRWPGSRRANVDHLVMLRD